MKIKRTLTKKEILRLAGEGYSCGDISKIGNISRQRVHQIIKKNKNLLKFEDTIFSKGEMRSTNKIIYKNIREWLQINAIGFTSFCKVCDNGNIKGGWEAYPTGRFLAGKGNGNIKMIKTILSTTGLKFEEAFEEENC